MIVVSAKKSFWASNECKVFPKRVYTKIFFGNSQNILNTLFITFLTYLKCWIYRPKIILFGAVAKIVPFFIIFKKFKLIPPTKLIITTQLYFNDKLAQYVDKIIVYSRSQIKLHHPKLKKKYVFFHLPADGDYNPLFQKSKENYIFSGGGDGRDFKSLIEAVKGMDVNLKLITFSKKSLGYKEELPKNIQVLWRMPLQRFLEFMASSLFVVVPLTEGL